MEDRDCDNYLFPRNGTRIAGSNDRPLHCTRTQLNPSLLEVDSNLQAELIDLYFVWQNPWFPVLDEPLFRSSQEQGDGRYFTPLLLNCVLAAGSRFSDRHELRANPDDAKSAGLRFLKEAEVLLHYDLKAPNFTTIQAVAIMIIAYCVGIL